MPNIKDILNTLGNAFFPASVPDTQPSPNILPLLLTPLLTQNYASYTPDPLNPYAQDILDISRKEGIDPSLVEAIMWQESKFNPKAQSKAGAKGLMQLMPATFRAMGGANIFDPKENITAGIKYLKQQLQTFKGDPRLALAAYNAGPNAVMRYGTIPPYKETENYIDKIMERYGLTTQSLQSQPLNLTPLLK